MDDAVGEIQQIGQAGLAELDEIQAAILPCSMVMLNLLKCYSMSRYNASSEVRRGDMGTTDKRYM